MNKFVILTFFAVVVGIMADYPKPPPPPPPHHAYGPPPPPLHHAPPPPPPPPHHGYAPPPPAPVVHSYPVHAPHAKCGANLLVGCAPSVAHVPCVPLPAHGYPANHYRASESDSFDQFEE